MSSPRKVLVVEDESSARNALAALLRDEGFDVETAHDGDDAMNKIVAFRPAAALVDLEMPGMDGIELVARMRQLRDPPSVIAMSAYGDTGRALSALRAGATDYLTKPLRFDALLVVLAKAIRLHDMEREIDLLRARRREVWATK